MITTHHLEELPAATTHALLLRDGRVVATGPVEETLTPAALSTCFGLPVDVGAVARPLARGGGHLKRISVFL